MSFLEVPKTITFNQLVVKNSLSPANYMQLKLLNENKKPLRELVTLPIKGGTEVGSKEYIPNSNKYFIRTKSFQPESLLLDLKEGPVVPIRPQAFVDHLLKAGDILILKDSNVGEVVYLEKDLPNHMISGAIKKLEIKENKLYVLAFLKSGFFKKQIEFLIGKGATIRHAQDKYLDCLIPFPNGESAPDVLRYVSEIISSIIRKEKMLKLKHEKIHKLINDELIQGKDYNTNLKTNINDFVQNSRMDAGFYSPEIKRMNYYIENYPHGSKTIFDLGFKLSRGQNLQVSAIGKSIYSSTYKSNYYKLYLPTHITEYGTISKTVYLGNSSELKCLEQGDLVIGAEGFEKGRSVVITEDINNVITNIHGIILKSQTHNLQLSIFVRCFLDYLRINGIIDRFAVGGNGGSLAMRYWDNIKFPIFRQEVIQKINDLYHNVTKGASSLPTNKAIDFDIFEKIDNEITQISGILELDQQIKQLRIKLDKIIEDICLNKNVSIDFDLIYLTK